MREIVLDTETTGLDANATDRVVEIGCVELINHIPSGQTYHVYINPERSMPRAAFDVHGLSDEFLKDKPKFREIGQEFARFIDGGRLVIHNAAFDVGFLNAEFARLGIPAIASDMVVDTLQLARRRHPAGPNSLDALCARYGINNSRRTRHGALLDAELLAEVYIELIGGKQAALFANDGNSGQSARGLGVSGRAPTRQRPTPLAERLTEAERETHSAFIGKMGDAAIWKLYEN
ncbi:MAG: DNA polymerase III subunit epsilon [Ancalomicrobiaceae bacterium]|nr:DNA polymerase III subunit epsilon [Ancalomicrobiaceae bacterium]